MISKLFCWIWRKLTKAFKTMVEGKKMSICFAAAVHLIICRCASCVPRWIACVVVFWIFGISLHVFFWIRMNVVMFHLRSSFWLKLLFCLCLLHLSRGVWDGFGKRQGRSQPFAELRFASTILDLKLVAGVDGSSVFFWIRLGFFVKPLCLAWIEISEWKHLWNGIHALELQDPTEIQRAIHSLPRLCAREKLFQRFIASKQDFFTIDSRAVPSWVAPCLARSTNRHAGQSIWKWTTLWTKGLFEIFAITTTKHPLETISSIGGYKDGRTASRSGMAFQHNVCSFQNEWWPRTIHIGVCRWTPRSLAFDYAHDWGQSPSTRSIACDQMFAIGIFVCTSNFEWECAGEDSGDSAECTAHHGQSSGGHGENSKWGFLAFLFFLFSFFWCLFCMNWGSCRRKQGSWYSRCLHESFGECFTSARRWEK